MEATALPATLSMDMDMEAQVADALRALDALRPAPAEVNVSANQGVVTLTGIVPSRMTAAEVARVARGVPGVTGVSNRLMDDGSLILQVARALAADPRTRAIPPGYRVMCVFGRVILVGRFGDEPQRRAAVEVAQGVAGVRSAKVVPTD